AVGGKVGRVEYLARAVSISRALVLAHAAEPGVLLLEQPDAHALDLERAGDQLRRLREDGVQRALLVHAEARETAERVLEPRPGGGPHPMRSPPAIGRRRTAHWWGGFHTPPTRRTGGRMRAVAARFLWPVGRVQR